MCKIMLINGISPTKQKALWKWTLASVAPMTASDPHGFGYAAISSDGLYGERWLNPKDAFKVRTNLPEADQALLDAYGDMLRATKAYSRFGSLQNAGTSTQGIMLHARFATCAHGIENTHPFVRDNTALIHNGVISNASALTNLTSTCDSETILNEYVSNDVPSNPGAIQDVADTLDGYYACGVLTQQNSRWVMDIFKDSRAQLYCAFVKELGTAVFCTSDKILQAVAKKTKFRLGTIFEVEAGRLLRVDVETGMNLGVIPFEPGLYSKPGIGLSFKPQSDTFFDQWKKDREAREAEEKATRWTKDTMTEIDDEQAVDEAIRLSLASGGYNNRGEE